MRRAAFILCLLATGCASPAPRMPANVGVGTGPLPVPRTAANVAPPRIIAARFSSLDVHRPGVWSGTIVTTTNVASLELRTNQFSISVPRAAFGRFNFTLRIYDVPDEFIRSYTLRIIARNSAGVKVEEDAPFRIE